MFVEMPTAYFVYNLEFKAVLLLYMLYVHNFIHTRCMGGREMGGGGASEYKVNKISFVLNHVFVDIIHN